MSRGVTRAVFYPLIWLANDKTKGFFSRKSFCHSGSQTLSVRNIPKFRDRASFCLPKHRPSAQKLFTVADGGGQRRTEHCYFVLLLIDANGSRLGFTLFRRKHLMKRIRVLFIARNPWDVWIFQTNCRGRGFSGMFYKLIEAHWSRVKIAVESVWKFLEIVQNRNGTTY